MKQTNQYNHKRAHEYLVKHIPEDKLQQIRKFVENQFDFVEKHGYGKDTNDYIIKTAEEIGKKIFYRAEPYNLNTNIKENNFESVLATAETTNEFLLQNNKDISDSTFELFLFRVLDAFIPQINEDINDYLYSSLEETYQVEL